MTRMLFLRTTKAESDSRFISINNAWNAVPDTWSVSRYVATSGSALHTFEGRKPMTVLAVVWRTWPIITKTLFTRYSPTTPHRLTNRIP